MGQRTEIEDKLSRDLPKGLGVRRPDLYGTLGVQLRTLWGIQSPDDPVLEMVEWHLEWLISQIQADARTPAYKKASVVQQCQHAARVTYNISIPEVAGIPGVVARREWLGANGGPSPSESQRDMTKVIPQFVAILQRGQDALPSREHVLAELARRKRPGDALVDRPEYIEQIRAHIAAGNMVLCLWGEPGTGKTVLATQVVGSLGRGPALVLRAGDSRLLQRDIRDALAAEGQESASLTDDQCLSSLRRLLSGQPKSGALVVDDVESAQLLEYILPRTPGIPVIVTSRLQIGGNATETMHVQEFTEGQALVFVRQRLGEVDEDEARSLVQLLGARPLALDHALRFLHECPDVSLHDLLQTLAKSAVRLLDNVAAPTNADRNLVTLYRTILTPLLEGQDVRRLLDAFLAITGGYGASARELLYFFMQSEVGGNFDRLTFRAGLRTLAHYGLVREGGWALIMHSLTFDILRELRGAALYGIEQDYLWFLLGGEVREFTEDEKDGRHWAWLLKVELLAATDLLPGWKCMMCVDRRTWLALRTDGDSSGSYIARYEVRADVGAYKLDYRIGQRSPISFEEGQQLYGLVGMVADAVRRAHSPDGRANVDPE
jgi:hypothetical protein